MSGVPTGHLALGWAWLPPAVDSLLSLADDSPSADTLLRDPLAVAHVLRYARPTPSPTRPTFTPGYLSQAVLTDTAATLLESLPNVPKELRLPDPVSRVLDLAAHVAARLAESSETVAADAAVAATRLAGLGWMAVAASDPAACEKCLSDPAHIANPEAVQRRHWGLDAATVTRRLLARWRLPAWAANTVGFLKLSVEDTEPLGVPRDLFEIVQASLLVAEEQCGRLGLVHHNALTSSSQWVRAAHDMACSERDAPVESSPPPFISRPLLIRLLRATARSRRASGAVWLAESEETIDKLGTSITQLRAEFDVRLRDAKLESLAEFAAGASHEINNPLAVISGQAQLLLAHEEDEERRSQLQAIVRQTKRVHELLQGTMQYARPPRPRTSAVPLHPILHEVDRAYRPDAEARNVRLDIDRGEVASLLQIDATQARQALGHLVRNAIEATPTDGWVRVGVEIGDESVSIVVADSGAGPTAEHVPHLFDPFFSGRRAGRGRGLGLSVAWRLARLNGGSVRFDPSGSCPSRFVLVLPQAVAASPSIPEGRQSA